MAAGEQAGLGVVDMPELAGLTPDQCAAYEKGWGDLVDLYRRPNGDVSFYDLFSAVAEPVELDPVTQQRLARIAVWPQGSVPDPYRLQLTESSSDDHRLDYPDVSQLEDLKQAPGVLEHVPEALVWAMGKIATLNDDEESSGIQHRYYAETYRSGRGYGMPFILSLANYLSTRDDQVGEDGNPPLYEQLLTLVPIGLDYLSSNSTMTVRGDTPQDPYSYHGTERTIPLTPKVRDLLRGRFLNVLDTDLPDASENTRNRVLFALSRNLIPEIAHLQEDEATDISADLGLPAFTRKIMDIVDQYQYPTYYGVNILTDSLMALVGSDNKILLAAVATGVEETLARQQPVGNTGLSATVKIMNRLPADHELRSKLQQIIDRNPALQEAADTQRIADETAARARRQAEAEALRTKGAMALGAMRIAVESVVV